MIGLALGLAGLALTVLVHVAFVAYVQGRQAERVDRLATRIDEVERHGGELARERSERVEQAIGQLRNDMTRAVTQIQEAVAALSNSITTQHGRLAVVETITDAKKKG